MNLSTVHNFNNKAKKIFSMTLGVFKELYKNKVLYIMVLPAVIILFLFSYLPLSGLVIAFKDFNFVKGLFGSPWQNPIYNNFTFLFSSEAALRSARNTILLNALFIFSGVVFEVGLALMINEIGSKIFKKISQTFTFLPFFISWIVVGVFSYNLFTSDHSSFNTLLSSLGLNKVDFVQNPGIWPFILVCVNRWKLTGYGAVIYLATVSGIDSSYYEAAKIDGATKARQIWYISLPLLRPTVIILVILQIGRIMNADFGMFYSMIGDAGTLYSTTDVIDTFVYRALRQTSDVGMASAAGFIQSVMSFFLVIGANLVARRIDKDSALF